MTAQQIVDFFNHRGLIDQGPGPGHHRRKSATPARTSWRCWWTYGVFSTRGRILGRSSPRNSAPSTSTCSSFEPAPGAARADSRRHGPAARRAPGQFRRTGPSRGAGRSAESADVEDLRFALGKKSIVVVARDGPVEELINEHYGGGARRHRGHPRPARQSGEAPATPRTSKPRPTARRSSASWTSCSTRRSRRRPRTSTSSRSRTSSRSATAWTARSTRWRRRRCTWPLRSSRASRSWRT